MKFSVNGGGFSYSSSERTILRDISFSLSSGEVLAILGPNGAGKTTLLRCCLGFLPWQQGSSALDGRDIRTMGKRELWRRIAYVPQARQTSSAYTVEEMVLFGRSSRFGPFSLPGKADLEKVDEVLERLHLTHLRNKSCARISGGELQMVLIARALAAEPELLVLDEPESNLDFKNQLLVLDTISALAAEGLACLFNTHYPAHALRRATHSLLLSRDGTYLCGPTPGIVTEENIGRCFGVQAVIGEMETPENVYPDVVPVAIGSSPVRPSADPSRRVVACLSIILPDRSQAERINALIHQASPWIVGRMGMPHPEAGMYLINLVLDGPWSEVSRLAGALSLVPGVSAKATYAKEVSSHE